MKKLLILNFEYPPLGGGGGIAAKTIAEAYIQRGFQVDYVTTWFKGLKFFETNNGLNIYRVKVLGRKNIETSSWLSLISYPFCALRTTVALCKKNNYSFIHTHFAVPTGILGVYIAKRFRIKNMLIVHGGDIYDPTKKFSPHKKWYLRKIVQYVLNHSDIVVAHSQDISQHIKKWYHCQKKIPIIALPYEPNNFIPINRQELALRDDKQYIICIARLIPRKGVQFILKALALIKDVNIEAIIIGDGPEKISLQQLAQQLKIAERVHFVGRITGEKKFQYLYCSDIYILPSIYEAFGIVIQEGMQVGLPLIITPFGGPKDLVQENENGYIIDPSSTVILAKKIEELMHDVNTRKKMKENNKKKIQIFFPSCVIDEHLRLLNEIEKNSSSDKINVLILNYEFPPLGGGAGNATYYLAKELCKHPDIRFDIITASTGKNKIQKIGHDNTIYYVDIKKGHNVHFQTKTEILRYAYEAYKKGKKLIKQKKYHFIHAFFGIPSGYVAMKLKIPYIVSLRGSDVPFYNQRFFWLDTLLFKRLSKKIWKRAGDIITNSAQLKSLAENITDRRDIQIIHNGVDIETFRPADKKNNDKFVIISTSRLIKRKGIQFLLEAFLILSEKYTNIELLVIGNGDQSSILKNMVKDAKRKVNVKFLEAIPHEKLPAYYQMADVFVLPSLNEGMSNSVLEAMASGLVIVTTDTGGTKELVDSSNGIIIKPESSTSIIEAMEKLYNDKILLTSMKRSSRLKAQQKSWKKMCEEYLSIYKKYI